MSLVPFFDPMDSVEMYAPFSPQALCQHVSPPAFFCRYSFESKSWSSFPSLPSPKGFGAAAECNGTLYAAPRFRLRRTKITKARTDSSSAVLQMVMSLTRCRCETVGLLARDGDEHIFQFGHISFYRVLLGRK
jgi:hypothetical protein